MPFKSKSQMRYMFAKMPKKAKEWADETPSIKSLPEKKKKSKSKKVSADEFWSNMRYSK